MQDIFSKCYGDGGYFAPQRMSGDTFFSRPLLSPHPSNRMMFQGKECIMWSINNYLGLANNQDLHDEAIDSVQEFGLAAPMGSRMMSGTTSYHRQLEQQLADFSQKEASYLFNYGYLGVLGTMSAIAGPKDTIITDKLAHACIIDGGILSRAQLRFFKHNHIADLEAILKQVAKTTSGGVLVAIEGVYGMTGDVANLKDIAALKKQYNFRLFVDDAHGFGVMGSEGRGTADFHHCQDEVDIYFATFAKAFAAIGGFSASQKPIMEWIEYNARTQIFAKSLPMAYTKTLARTLELVRGGDAEREKMWHISNVLKSGLRDLGFTIGPGASPICSVFMPTKDGDQSIGRQTIQYLRERGIFVTAVVYPVIPPDLLMFRMIPTATHTEEDLARTLQVFSDMKEELQLQIEMDEQARRKLRQIFGNQI